MHVLLELQQLGRDNQLVLDIAALLEPKVEVSRDRRGRQIS
jgi:hypothetical protein